MRIFLRVTVSGQSHTYTIDLDPHGDVSQVHRFVQLKHPSATVSNVLYAGKKLTADESLADFKVEKECTLQVLARHLDGGDMAPGADELSPNTRALGSCSLSRQRTSDALAFGDALIVMVVAGRQLKAADFFTRKSDPYCVLTVSGVLGSRHDVIEARTSVASNNLDPVWKETFGFRIYEPGTLQSRGAMLDVTVWDHDYLSPDDFLGSVHVALDSIPRVTAADGRAEVDGEEAQHAQWLTLEGIEQGEVQLLIRRVPLTSPDLADALSALQLGMTVSKYRSRTKHKLHKKKKGKVRSKKPWSKRLLQKSGVSIEHFLGDEPFVFPEETADMLSNPAIVHLESVLRDRTLVVTNERTLMRVWHILASQRALPLAHDRPSRYLWLLGLGDLELGVTQDVLYSVLQEASANELKALVYLDTPGAALATFRSVEAATLALLSLQGRMIKLFEADDEEDVSVSGMRDDFVVLDRHDSQQLRVDIELGSPDGLRLGFARGARLELVEPDDPQSLVRFAHELQDGAYAHVFAVAGPVVEQAEAVQVQWTNAVLVLRGQRLQVHSRMAAEEDAPRVDWALSDVVVLRSGPWTLELLHSQLRSTLFLRHESDAQLEELVRVCREARGGDDLEVVQAEGTMCSSACVLCGEIKPLSWIYMLNSTWQEVEAAENHEDEDDLPLIRDVKRAANPNAVTCLPCLSTLFHALLQEPDRHVASQLLVKTFAPADLTDIGTRTQFERYVEMLAHDLLDEDASSMVTCPNEACGYTFEVILHSYSSRKQSETKDMGLDRRPLDNDAQRHFLTHRFFCPECEAEFCRLCGARPYHLGFDCAGFVEFQNAPKCRFCGAAVLSGRNKMPDADAMSPALYHVCANDECQAKAARSCMHFGCEQGHGCPGVRGERVCPAATDGFECLECSGGAGEFCNICYAEELAAAPIVRLACGHVFHEHCVKGRLESGGKAVLAMPGSVAAETGGRLGFRFATCPLCNQWMRAPAIDDMMERVEDVLDQVLKKVEVRLRMDLRDPSDPSELAAKVTDPSSRFFGKPLAAGMEAYAFYKCSSCAKVYFGGLRVCNANVEGEQEDGGGGPKDTAKCNACMQVAASGNNCNKPEHADWLQWKCRYCCSLAVWQCFADPTHFCDVCHPPRGVSKHVQCPNEDGVCPLGLPVGTHQNGPGKECEYIIGCMKCREEAMAQVDPDSAEHELPDGDAIDALPELGDELRMDDESLEHERARLFARGEMDRVAQDWFYSGAAKQRQADFLRRLKELGVGADIRALLERAGGRVNSDDDEEETSFFWSIKQRATRLKSKLSQMWGAVTGNNVVVGDEDDDGDDNEEAKEEEEEE